MPPHRPIDDTIAARPKDAPSMRSEAAEITGREAAALWWMGLVLVLIAAILGCLALVKS